MPRERTSFVRITISTEVAAPIGDVWAAWTTPSDIEAWNTASDEWHCSKAELDLRPQGRFSYRMAARDGSLGFDFAGTFTRIVPHEVIAFQLDDARPVTVEFVAGDNQVTVRETFKCESEHGAEQQRQGWQAILDRFAQHVESKTR